MKYTVFKDTDKEFYGSLYKISKHFNINYDRLYYNVINKNLAIDDIINSELEKKNNIININNNSNNSNSSINNNKIIYGKNLYCF